MNANDYARATGRHDAPEKPKEIVYPVLRPARALTPEQEVRVAETQRLVHAHIPEAVPMIHSLAKLGMIHGWRDVKVEVFETGEVA